MAIEQTTETTNIDPNVVDATLNATEESSEIIEETNDATEGLTTEENITPEYTPSLKFKVRDEELDMPEWAHSYIKDEETEKNFVDLFTAQKGIELAKTEREEFKSKYTELETAVVEVSKLANEGKIDRFIEALGLPKKHFIDYAINELKYQELPEEQKREIDAQRQAEFQAEQQNVQYTQMQQQYEAQQVQMRQMELSNTIIGNPEYAEAERIYDTEVGTPGAFKNLVAQCGHYAWSTQQRDLSVAEAVNEAIRVGRVQVGTQQPAQTVNNVGTQANSVTQQEKPVIPNFKAGGASPVKKGFTSIAELRAHTANRR